MHAVLLCDLVDGLHPMDRFQAYLGLEFRPKYFALRSAHRPFPYRFGQQLKLLS